MKIYKNGQILTVLRSSELLASGRHQSIITLLQELSKLPDDYFAALYEAAINNFAEFVQVLPIQLNGPLSGLLNRGLARADIVLKNFVLKQGESVDPLWNYAVFTAALFSDVSKAVINQKVIIVDKEGVFIDDWRPFEGSMISLGQYYKMYSISNSNQRLRHSITPLLARQLLPELGFLWLSSDPKVFADWLDALRGEGDQGGRVASALTYFRREDELNSLESIPQVDINPIESDATKHGEAFFNWLKNAIENKEIKINTRDASVHVVDAGVFLDRKIFKEFADIYTVPVNMNSVFTQFGNLLGIEKKGGGDYVFDQRFSEYGGKTSISFTNASHHHRSQREGVVVSDPNLIFVHKENPGVSRLLKSSDSNSSKNTNLPAGISKKGSVNVSKNK